MSTVHRALVRAGEHPSNAEWSGCPLAGMDAAAGGPGCIIRAAGGQDAIEACGGLCAATAGCNGFNVARGTGRCCLKSGMDLDGKFYKSNSDFYKMVPGH